MMVKKALPVAYIAQLDIISENSDQARELHAQGQFGTLLEDGRVQFSPLETFYLLEFKRLVLKTIASRMVTFEKLAGRLRRHDKNFSTRYAVFKDLRNRGYTVKTALKFGADFRVYDRGVRLGEDHARWIVYPVRENSSLTWHEFSAKNRVAHSTKKNLLVGVVDDEGDVSYWEIRWLRP